MCGGTAWGSSTLAVTSIWHDGGGTLIQTGVLFNSTKTFALYEGPKLGVAWDFRRVAAHELGHALGLDHTVYGNLMQPNFSDTREVPWWDDWDGVEAMYGVGGAIGGVLGVTPRPLVATLGSSGPSGGPFAVAFGIYRVRNHGDTTMSYQVGESETWLTIEAGSGSVPVYQDREVAVIVTGDANSLGPGVYVGPISFTNLSNGQGDTSRDFEVEVGVADSDGDLEPNASDNCPGVSNASQTNSGALPAGDACQCGDPDGSNTVDLIDAVRIERFAAGLPTGTFDSDRCSAAGDVLVCDAADGLAIRGYLAGLAGLPNLCRAAAAL